MPLEYTHLYPVAGCPPISHNSLLAQSVDLITELQQGKDNVEKLEVGDKTERKMESAIFLVCRFFSVYDAVGSYIFIDRNFLPASP